MVAVRLTFLTFLLLVVGIKVFFGIIQMPFSDLIQAIFVEQECSFIMGGKFLDFGHG